MKMRKNITVDDMPMLEPGEDMMMTEDEICYRFRKNGCYNDHIVILAQLNAVYPDTIAEILYRNGLYPYEKFVFEPKKRGNCA